MLFADWPVFLGLTLVVFGAAAWQTGVALASTWRPAWQVVIYGILLAMFDRFLHWSLFGADLLSLSGLIRDLVALIMIGLIGWRINQVTCMVRQYPWLYERSGLFGWRSHHD